MELEFGLLVLMKGGKPESSEKNTPRKARANNKRSPRMAPCRDPTRVTLVGDARSHHCAMPATSPSYDFVAPEVSILGTRETAENKLPRRISVASKG